MNYYLLIAGILAVLATIGHFAVGTKDFLKPVLNSNIDEIPKKVMHSLFHYMSVFMIITSVILISFALGNSLVFEKTNDVVLIIAIVYSGFAVIQLIIALNSSIKMGVFKLFQWIFWTLIALFLYLSL